MFNSAPEKYDPPMNHNFPPIILLDGGDEMASFSVLTLVIDGFQ
ncbi:hypothetical protein [Rouxiella silvae]|nr:hypothetical protein [Rouxiella silvae]